MAIDNGRYTARMDGPFVVFTTGMWLPFNEEAALRALVHPNIGRGR